MNTKELLIRLIEQAPAEIIVMLYAILLQLLRE